MGINHMFVQKYLNFFLRVAIFPQHLQGVLSKERCVFVLHGLIDAEFDGCGRYQISAPASALDGVDIAVGSGLLILCQIRKVANAVSGQRQPLPRYAC